MAKRPRGNGNSVERAFAAAVSLHRHGDLDGAARAYRRLLRAHPGHGGALVNLAAVLRRLGRRDDALACYREAATRADAGAALWFNFGNLLDELRHDEEAERAFRRALQADPGQYRAMTNLGRLLGRLGRIDEAVALHRRALAIEPRNAVSLRALGQHCLERREHEEARRLYRAVLDLEPGDTKVMNALGVVEKELGDSEAAMRLWRQAIESEPRSAAAHNNLGVMLRLLRRPTEAVDHLRAALAIDPRDSVTAANLVHALLNLGQTTEAEATARGIIAREPDNADGHLMLGFALAYQAEVDAAVDAFLESHRLAPDSPLAISNALFASLYSETRDAAAVAALHRELAPRILPAAPPRTSWRNDRDPDRRLRVGYLSPDLRGHPVAMFVEPLLAHHDPAVVDVHCYSTTEAADATTERLRACRNTWHDCRVMDDAALAARIEADGIDILVELAGHSAGNRARVLRARPAPVQALYIGYPGSSGLPEVDWLIADERTCPAEHDRYYDERIARLPRAFWCFQPPDAPAPAPPPFAARGTVTFGSYNALQKLSDSTVRLWARVLDAVPDSRLALKSLSFADPSVRDAVTRRFAAAGVAGGRVAALPPSDRAAFHAEYRHLDIALDPVPYNGGTTTCEALWMGVPVVALEGGRFCGRMSAALLRILGLDDLVASTPEEYVAIAAALAADPARLVDLHATLRQRMADSPICDGPGMTRDLENVYRRLWRHWCETAAPRA